MAINCLNPLEFNKMPNYAKIPLEQRLTLPRYIRCGKCEACQNFKKWNQYIKISEDILTNNENEKTYFVTLTYAGNTKYINKKHIQQWLKKLKYQLTKWQKKTIKYTIIGEYGEITHRPHYHALITSENQYINNLIQNTWKMGIINIKQAQEGHIHYLASHKIKNKNNWILQSHNTGRKSYEQQIQNIKNTGNIIIKSNKIDWNKCEIPATQYYRAKAKRAGIKPQTTQEKNQHTEEISQISHEKTKNKIKHYENENKKKLIEKIRQRIKNNNLY